MSKEGNNNSSEINKKGENELLQFFIGIILLGVGLFLISQKVVVHGSWYSWSIGGYNISSGMTTIPLIIGIIWYFFNRNSIIPKMIMVLGALFIIVSIILSVRINFVRSSLFEYILIFGMTAAGTGLVLKTLFKKKN